MTAFRENSNNILRLTISVSAVTAMPFHLNKRTGVHFDNYSLILPAIAVLLRLSAFIGDLSVSRNERRCTRNFLPFILKLVKSGKIEVVYRQYDSLKGNRR